MSNTEKLTKVDITKVAIVGALDEEVAHISSALEN
ncbi:5'-methylthioadenosine nucleosidase, partial [Bifidobacteriaceae bacterium WP012]